MSTTPALPDSFGPALRFLRKRARLTQDELGRAVGYSREQIARLENGSRLPDLAVIAALFVPALMLGQDRNLTEQLMALAGQTRRDQRVIITRTKETRVQLVQETISAPRRPQHIPPAPLLPLIGRQVELDDVLGHLGQNRLVTIIGAPGIGKTRLALEIANAALGQFADGVVFISLAEVLSPDGIPHAVLPHLDFTPAPHQSPAEAALACLAPRQLLLVMDNCEHLVEGTVVFTDWLARAPGLKILCTSRVPLDLYGEQEWPLAPLAVPDLAEPAQVERWGQYPAMRLLLARAQAADPGFRLTAENVLPLATLCVALDGLPLALELAAVRLRELSPALLVQQLLALRGHAQLSSTWLGQTRRNVAERHRTLQAAINWSVHLLAQGDREVFERLGVFTGGCVEEAALAVAQANPLTLGRLARANLIRLEGGRVHLLETLRAFAQEQLTAAGQLPGYREAHARYYAGFAGQVFNGLGGEDQGEWMRRALADHDNCLAALRWALDEGKGDVAIADVAIAIAGDLWWFWYRRGLFDMARDLLGAALELPSSDPAARARALNGAASFCLTLEDYDANLAYHQEGLALRRQLADSEGIATTLHNMGLTALTMGDYDQAMTWLKESIAVYPQDQTSALAHLGLIAQETLHLDQAREWLELAYQGAMASADRWMQAFTMNYLADVLRELGDFGEATRLAQASLDLFAELDDSYYLPDAQLTLAQIALDEGDYATAAMLAGLAREQYEARDDPVFVSTVLLVAAELALKAGAPAEASCLWEQARALRQTVKRAVSPREQASFDRLAVALLA